MTFSAYAVHTCQEVAERQPTPQATRQVFWKGATACLGEKSETCGARGELANAERASQGVGAFALFGVGSIPKIDEERKDSRTKARQVGRDAEGADLRLRAMQEPNPPVAISM